MKTWLGKRAEVIHDKYIYPPKRVDAMWFYRFATRLQEHVIATCPEDRLDAAGKAASWMHWLAVFERRGTKPVVRKVLRELIYENVVDREWADQTIDDLVRVLTAQEEPEPEWEEG
jgi:hypothetical protein